MIVLDASTLILLAKCDLLPLLAEKTPLAIPPEVEREASAKPELYDAKVIASMIKGKQIQVLKLAHAQHRKQVQEDFGIEAGEAEALLLAKEKGVPLGTDDWPAIKAAKIMGIPFVTAINVLIELCRKNRLSTESALSKLDKLESVGRYHVRIVENARERIQETR